MTELLTILTTAKEAGFEAGTIVSIMGIGFLLYRMTNKQVDKVVKALDGLKEEIKEIKAHVGLK
ncbi:MAG: hypothetical protein OM95_06920 [Bdellovibrio sp. ArHS]|uniref:hypothetical protein n=1 Tax=Bdellovibrio sp. ArHS TaxID=1569284 RepID=UPI000583D5C8|nr:hypothetical protein [Bdellovibrio sp. ArHS]KHD88842.1 MAG: hypothetical protein OM95_06920 [Bdellovibrio sp. ArHS]